MCESPDICIISEMERREGIFKGYEDLDLYYRCWLPDEKPKAVLVVVHGLAEHSERYSNVVDYFVPKGYAVYSYDQRGHGKSEGVRSYVDDFSEYIKDLDTFMKLVDAEQQAGRKFLVGHSLGGLIAVAYAIEHQRDINGLLVSGTILEIGSSVSPVLVAMAKVLSVLVPKMGTTVLDATTISKDNRVVDAYVNDPLVYRGKIRARMGAELIRTTRELPARLGEIKLPILIMHGSEDRLSDPAGSRILYEHVGSEDKTLKIYEGYYHEIYNEPEREQVFKDMEEWLSSRI